MEKRETSSNVPDFPYHPERRLTIRTHVPPEPFGPGHYKEDAPRPMVPAPKYKTNLEWCLQNPPVETPPPEDLIVYTLCIVGEVACKPGRKVQLVSCYIEGAKDNLYIAKIYDALYCESGGEDITWWSDLRYAREASAYQDLGDADLDGKYTPKYFGSWTFDLPAPQQRNPTRPVRMIIIEYIPGPSICEILDGDLASRIPREGRLGVMAEIAEMWVQLKKAGVQHDDMAPRNVMLRGLDLEQKGTYKLKPVLIDLEMSLALGRDSCRYGLSQDPLASHPKYWLGLRCPEEWHAWVPEPESSKDASWRAWVLRIFEGREFATDEIWEEMWEERIREDAASNTTTGRI
ncbi:hypothetical protein B0I35DRAFT_388341 [Stachybotrys elegans]|uniref:Uncharacterized protein n=1 Tax=Stachybotrys elegans TaxID=80388 RepID=A0A8K0STH7_9HYPO|nr:hypothetical protein B0I35DRAFT_388341 [Stachybotrys elegans]